MEDVYTYVGENLSTQGRPFYLYETPPKKMHTDMKPSLNKLKMVPSALLYFGWTDLDQTKHSDGPFVDLLKLKPYFVQMWEH